MIDPKTILSWKLYIPVKDQGFPAELQDAICNQMLLMGQDGRLVLRVGDNWAKGYVQGLVDSEVPGAQELQIILQRHRSIELFFKKAPGT